MRLIDGAHDGFPSYEIFGRMGRSAWKVIYFHDANKKRQGALSLLPTMEWSIDKPEPWIPLGRKKERKSD